MSRRLWLVAVVLATAFALTTTAAAAPRHFKIVGGARHLGKPMHHHLIAVRHGRRIHWFSATHGLAKKRLPPIKLSRDVRLGLGIRAFGPTSTPTVAAVGGCSFPSLSLTTPDGMTYIQSYGGLYADVLNCVGNNGGTTMGNASYANCHDYSAKSVQVSDVEVATFMDGEWMALCTTPDDNGSGGSQANSQNGGAGAPYVVYQQGFGCQAAVGVGSADNTAYLASTKDSLEYSQTYVENGQNVRAITTSCIGRLPNTVTVDTSAPVYHLVSCTQYDPFATGEVVRGLGETITYPDRQFQETCNDPAYDASVACTAGTNCSTDLSADQTSNLLVTESPTTGGNLTENVDYGTQLSCAGYLEGFYTGFDPNWYGFSYSGTGSKQLSYELFSLPYSANNNVQFCFGSNVQFAANTPTGAGAPGTLPDGTPGFIGVLPTCGPNSTGPCVSSVGPVPGVAPAAGTLVSVTIPATFAGDPFGHP